MPTPIRRITAAQFGLLALDRARAHRPLVWCRANGWCRGIRDRSSPRQDDQSGSDRCRLLQAPQQDRSRRRARRVEAVSAAAEGEQRRDLGARGGIANVERRPTALGVVAVMAG